MENNIRGKLFENYSSNHIEFLEEAEYTQIEWFNMYFKKYYFPICQLMEKKLPILEIGCNRGYLLNCLNKYGFSNLTGIDLSPDDLVSAKKIVGSANIICEDASTHLNKNKSKYGLIIIKAVLEHIEKDKISSLMHDMHNSLLPGGILIIDVPNMDWMFASHERYMDFTHEVGFTKESLGQLMRYEFGNARIISCDADFGVSTFSRMRRFIGRSTLNFLFRCADPSIKSRSIWCRSIIGVASNEGV